MKGAIRLMTSFAMLFCFPVQNFTEIGLLAADVWLKTIFKTEAVRHLKFLKCSYLVIWLSSSAVVYEISSKWDHFSLRYGDFMIFKMADLRGPIMDCLKSPCGTSYRSSIEP